MKPWLPGASLAKFAVAEGYGTDTAAETSDAAGDSPIIEFGLGTAVLVTGLVLFSILCVKKGRKDLSSGGVGNGEARQLTHDTCHDTIINTSTIKLPTPILPAVEAHAGQLGSWTDDDG
jgi:hypothetical protein